MVSRKYGARVVYGLCVLICLSMAGCAVSKSGFDHGKYEKLGWICVDKNYAAGLFGYQLMVRESDCSRIVKSVVEEQGLPDYLYNPERSILYLAYIDEGIVYKLNTGDQVIVSKDYFRSVDDLPDFLVERFVAVELKNRS